MQWSESESKRAFEMKAGGADLDDIADALGRSKLSVKAYLVRALIPKEKRKEQDARYHAKRALVRRLNREARIPSGLVVQSKDNRHTTAEAMRARAERDLAFDLGHQDITAAYCGDPLPGRSMLDRRMSG